MLLSLTETSGNFSERQLEAYNGDLLQDRRGLQIEGQHLRQAFGIQVLIPGEFGVVPGISEFPADQCEVPELMRSVVDVSLIDRDRLACVEVGHRLVGGRGIVDVAGSERRSPR